LDLEADRIGNLRKKGEEKEGERGCTKRLRNEKIAEMYRETKTSVLTLYRLLAPFRGLMSKASQRAKAKRKSDDDTSIWRNLHRSSIARYHPASFAVSHARARKFSSRRLKGSRVKRPIASKNRNLRLAADAGGLRPQLRHRAMDDFIDCATSLTK